MTYEDTEMHLGKDGARADAEQEEREHFARMMRRPWEGGGASRLIRLVSWFMFTYSSIVCSPSIGRAE